MREQPLDPNRCQEGVHNDFGVDFHQCVRRAIVKRNGMAYCKQHDPVAVRARAVARAAKCDAETDKRIAVETERQRKLDSQPALLAACEELWAWGQASCEGWDVSSQQAAQYGAKCLTFNEAIEQARAAIKAARGDE